MANSKYAKIFTVVISITIFLILAYQVNINELLKSLKQISLSVVFAVFIITGITYFLKSEKIRVIIGDKIKKSYLFFTICAYQLITDIMPLKTGDLSYFYFLKKTKKISSGQNLASLVIDRVSELSVITIIFIISLICSYNHIDPKYFYPLIIISSAFIISIVFFLIFEKKALTFFEKLFSKTFLINLSFIRRILNVLDNAATEIKLAETKTKMYKIFMITTISLTLQFFTTILLVKGFGFDIPYSIIIAGATFVTLSTVLPINTFLGLGTVEGAWTIIMIISGISYSIAISSVILIHLVRILILTTYGLAGIVYHNTR